MSAPLILCLDAATYAPIRVALDQAIESCASPSVIARFTAARADVDQAVQHYYARQIETLVPALLRRQI